MNRPLAGMKILVLEDEYLIAMDVEQLCRDHGASDVMILRSLDDVAAQGDIADEVHAAVLDLMLAGNSTTEFAQQLQTKGIPFVFATGFSDSEDIFTSFPGVNVVAKPYGGPMLIEAIADAIGKNGGKEHTKPAGRPTPP